MSENTVKIISCFIATEDDGEFSSELDDLKYEPVQQEKLVEPVQQEKLVEPVQQEKLVGPVDPFEDEKDNELIYELATKMLTKLSLLKNAQQNDQSIDQPEQSNDQSNNQPMESDSNETKEPPVYKSRSHLLYKILSLYKFITYSNKKKLLIDMTEDEKYDYLKNSKEDFSIGSALEQNTELLNERKKKLAILNRKTSSIPILLDFCFVYHVSKFNKDVGLIRMPSTDKKYDFLMSFVYNGESNNKTKKIDEAFHTITANEHCQELYCVEPPFYLRTDLSEKGQNTMITKEVAPMIKNLINSLLDYNVLPSLDTLLYADLDIDKTNKEVDEEVDEDNEEVEEIDTDVKMPVETLEVKMPVETLEVKMPVETLEVKPELFVVETLSKKNNLENPDTEDRAVKRNKIE